MVVVTTLKQKIALILFGFFLSIVILEIGLRLTVGIYLCLRELKNRERSGNNEYRILCLGESTTLEGGRDSYPAQLERILNQRMPDMRFHLINRGLPGTDTTAILEAQ